MKRWGIRLLKLLVTFAGICWVVSTMKRELLTSPAAAQELLASLRIDLLVGALVLTAVSMLLSSFQWRFLLRRQGIHFSVLQAVRLYFIGLFFNTFMPGNVGGDAKKVYDVYCEEGELSGGFAATFFDRLFGLFVLTVIGVVAGFLFWRVNPRGEHFFFSSLWILLGMAAGFAALFSKRIASGVARLLQWFRWPLLAKKFDTLRERFYIYRSAPLLSGVLLFSLLIQTTRILVHWMLALAIGLDAPLVAFFFFVPLIGVVSALPISIGGFGPRELLAQSLFALVAFSSIEAFVLTELSVLVVIVVSIPGGIAFLLSEKRRETPSAHRGEL